MVTKKTLNIFLKEVLLKKYTNLGISDIKLYGISFANKDHYNQIFIDVYPSVDKLGKEIEKKLSDDVYDFLSLSSEQGWDWDIFFDKRPLYNLDESLPFKETIKKNSRIRVFSESTDDSEFKWHQDNEDRLVSPLHDTNWMIQIDNELPQKLEPNEEIFIPEGVWHRIIKGDGDLKVKVKFI